EIHWRDVAKSDDIEALIARQAAKLDQLFANLTGCRIAIERPQKASEPGSPYRVRLDVTVPPGHELVVRRETMHAPLRTIVNETFKAMRRRVRDVRTRQRGEQKTHDEPRALVVRIFRDDGYGFLKTPEGRDIYFH